MSRLHTIIEFGQRATSQTEWPLVLKEGLRLTLRVLIVDRCELVSISSRGIVQCLGECAEGACRIEKSPTQLPDNSPVALVLQSQQPVIIENGIRRDCETIPGGQDVAAAGSLSAPLYGPDGVVGVLVAHTSHRRPFTAEDVDLLQTIAHLLSAAWQRAVPSDRRRQEKMHRAEQMMAIGQVAAGVAHELRNPLTSIKGLIQVNLREAVERGLPAEDLRVIDHEIRRMERTLQTFLDFARPPAPDFQPLDLHEVVQRVFSLVAGRARKQNVALTQMTEGPVVVAADRDQMQQLLLNLTLNALDAMPQGGSIKVELRPPQDGHVELVVTDNGPGIPVHVLPKVFETFVSSKETGVGLGLPVSLRIAEEHGGTLSAYNLSSGACFVLRLPCFKK